MSEQVGYEGPIYMTLPTKVIAPILLEDFRKVRSNGFNQNQAYFQGCYEARSRRSKNVFHIGND